MKKYYLWLDPWKNGWYAVIDGDKNMIETWAMPTIGKSKPEYDLQALKNIFLKYPYERIGIENPWVLFWAGKTTMMSLWNAVGLLQWMAAMTWIPYVMVQPKAWQKVMWKDIPVKKKPNSTKTDTKAMSELAAIRMFPWQGFLKTERSVKRHDGMIDASLIAWYVTIEH